MHKVSFPAFLFTLVAAVFAGLPGSIAQSVDTAVIRSSDVQTFQLSNAAITQRVMIRSGRLLGDVLSGNRGWLQAHHNDQPYAVSTDGDFSLEMMWTAWSAPGRTVHGDVQLALTKADFRYRSYAFKKDSGGGATLQLYFTAVLRANSLQLRLTYQLLPGKFYARRQIAVRDSLKQTNWLSALISRKGRLSSRESAAFSIVKKGAFGQPAAVDFNQGGVFFGVEYPAATTRMKRKTTDALELQCKEWIGTEVTDQWVTGKWVVEGLAPDHYVKKWFFKYLPDIRYAANRPYALYNSWYDLRSPAFKDVAPEHIMNENNILNIIDQFKKNMIEPYGIHLDAFVLDDGWDVHQSDWQLDPKTFPHGLRPISDALAGLGTTLGIWYGPTGGYSFRADRINWMRDHGYEVSGQGDAAMLCIGGKKYSALFEKRTTHMVQQGKVGYFKWDGLQFSCSDPTHGHPIGIYSRRALLDSLIAKCQAVRAINPDVFLNITSGTWLSPWWMMYANQIWMQGGDYGFADVPSFSQRDASMTYKDLVLYNDFHNLDQWFPLANLMTHGVIKGRLNEIGGQDDPLDKFTDDAMFYFGRGVTMYELYISPDLLNAGEWNALSKSLKWAEDRFDVLNNGTNMIGGDPTAGAAYGYVHFKGNQGVIAVRNPRMQPQQIEVKLDPAFGLDAEARSLVLERVYPDHWIAPDLYAAGASIPLPLQGYASAIYEVYPLDSARRPLLADAIFRPASGQSDQYTLQVLQAGPHPRFLNPEKVAGLQVNGRQATALDVVLPRSQAKGFEAATVHFDGAALRTEIHFDSSILLPRIVVVLHPDSANLGKTLPKGRLLVDGQAVQATRQHQKGVWNVYSYALPEAVAGTHTYQFELLSQGYAGAWHGHAAVWLVGQQKLHPVTVRVQPSTAHPSRPMPPSPYAEDAVGLQTRLGEGALRL